jgi:hypothetical protein
VIHDEGFVLCVHPSGQSDDDPHSPKDAEKAFLNYLEQVNGMVELLEASSTSISNGLPPINPQVTSGYKPNTAFIMMSMDPSNSFLQDIYDTLKTCFKDFGIDALRADDIEHDGVITKRILDEIQTSEFLLGDLTEERPSVYYEVGFAHAIGRRVTLYRKQGTPIHFDLAAYNCPEYINLRDLKDKLTRRLEHLTNRTPQSKKEK